MSENVHLTFKAVKYWLTNPEDEENCASALRSLEEVILPYFVAGLDENYDEPSVLLLFRKLIDLSNPGLNLLHTRNDVVFPDFTKFVHEYLQKNVAWIWLCFCHLEYFINPEKDLRNHFETAIKSTSGQKMPQLWLFFLQWAAKNAPGDVFALLQRFIAANSQKPVLIPVIRKYLPILECQQARDLLQNLALSPDPNVAFYCASIFWNNEQYLKCGACLKPIIDSGVGDEASYKLYIAGKFLRELFVSITPFDLKFKLKLP